MRKKTHLTLYSRGNVEEQKLEKENSSDFTKVEEKNLEKENSFDYINVEEQKLEK